MLQLRWLTVEMSREVVEYIICMYFGGKVEDEACGGGLEGCTSPTKLFLLFCGSDNIVFLFYSFVGVLEEYFIYDSRVNCVLL
ncbi:hypothetical protein HanRHA438_Chr16g0767151 [Helianthus annuus]|nr:hypothetical protein HanRHA438_Chr16g0767151 [Helianthus annuus]